MSDEGMSDAEFDAKVGFPVGERYVPKSKLDAAEARALAAEEREAVAQWCSGCHEVRSVDCYRADCPKSDTERRAAEILAAEANERARIAAYLNMRADQWRDLAVAHSGDALKWADCSARENELLRQSIAIERNEHGAGK